MPPPEQILPDRRRELEERRARAEAGEWGEDDPATAPATGHVQPRLPFADRWDAGEQLAVALAPLAGPDLVVLGVPRGGVEVAAAVAEALGAPLDVVIPKKVGAPGNPELGLGAVADGVEVLDERLIRVLGVSDDYLRA
jgi:hypothetical protein